MSVPTNFSSKLLYKESTCLGFANFMLNFMPLLTYFPEHLIQDFTLLHGTLNLKCIPSPFLKTMEKLLLLLLWSALKEHIDPYQFADKCKRSTLDTVVILNHNIVLSLEKSKKYVQLVFLDHNSAFDSIPRQLLLDIFISVNRQLDKQLAVFLPLWNRTVHCI